MPELFDLQLNFLREYHPYFTKKKTSIEDFNDSALRGDINRIPPWVFASKISKSVLDLGQKETESLTLRALDELNQGDPIWGVVAGQLEYLKYLHFQRIDFCEWGDRGYVGLDEAYDMDLVEEIRRLQIPGLDPETSLPVFAEELFFNYAGVKILTGRILRKGETISDVFFATALKIASKQADTCRRLNFIEELYLALIKRKISAATPILSNLRWGGSATSCFILSVEDNLDSITQSWTDTAKISKNGGGVGINLSSLRAKGSSVMGREGAAKGVVSWIKIINSIGQAVDQGGVRSGAITISIDVWHKDVFSVLDLQTEIGDLRNKAYDVFPQLVLTDEFMARVENNETWTLVDPHEVDSKLSIDLPPLWGAKFSEKYGVIEREHKLGKLKNAQVVNARELFSTILKTCITTGKPYLAFKDAINKENPNSHIGYIPGVNLCTESFSNVSPDHTHSCNLISLNLANIDLEDVSQYSNLAVFALDNIIDVTAPPTPRADAHNKMYRTVGVGTMGLADMLARTNNNYKSYEFINSIYERLSLGALQASVAIAEEKGSYPAFKGSLWDLGFLFGVEKTKFLEKCSLKESWETVINNLDKYGIRNSHLLAIAPNTSSSLIQGSTPSVLPPFQLKTTERISNNTLAILPPFAKDFKDKYTINYGLDQGIIVEAISEIQHWIDTGISMELVFNLSDYNGKPFEGSDLAWLVFRAWRQGLKTIYYIRTGNYTLNTQEQEIKKEICLPCEGLVS